MKLTLPQLEAARREAYENAEEIQKRLEDRLAHINENTTYTLNYIEQPSGDFYVRRLGVIPWTEANREAAALRYAGHTVTSLYGTADTSTTEDLRHELARAFDIASGIEAVIQQELRAQQRNRKAAA